MSKILFSQRCNFNRKPIEYKNAWTLNKKHITDLIIIDDSHLDASGQQYPIYIVQMSYSGLKHYYSATIPQKDINFPDNPYFRDHKETNNIDEFILELTNKTCFSKYRDVKSSIGQELTEKKNKENEKWFNDIIESDECYSFLKHI